MIDSTRAVAFVSGKVYRVYEIANLAGQTYLGLSADVQHRIDQHNAGLSKWTSRRGPWHLVWISRALDLSGASRLERALKRQKGGAGKAILQEMHSSSGS